MALILVALGAILLWFLIAPFLKPAPSASPKEVDPRVNCAMCGELCEPQDVIERELGEGRFHNICGQCIADMADDFARTHGVLPSPRPRTADES
jgi:hypothetical protein